MACIEPAVILGLSFPSIQHPLSVILFFSFLNFIRTRFRLVGVIQEEHAAWVGSFFHSSCFPSTSLLLFISNLHRHIGGSFDTVYDMILFALSAAGKVAI